MSNSITIKRSNFVFIVFLIASIIFALAVFALRSYDEYVKLRSEHEKLQTSYNELYKDYNYTISIAWSYFLFNLYTRYGIALRNMQATRDLVIAHYYAQYLDQRTRLEFISALPLPIFYVDDAYKEIDTIIKLLSEEEKWPSYLRDELVTLRGYFTELRGLVSQVRAIVYKQNYTKDDVEMVISIVELFKEYEDNIYEVVSRASG